VTLRTLAGSLMCSLALAAGAAAPRPAELIEGVPGVSGRQEVGFLHDRVVITWQGQDALSARLRLRDRGADFEGYLGGMPVRATCTTFNGFVLTLDCQVVRTLDAARVAHLRIPLY
jgi:hypothetical protein